MCLMYTYINIHLIYQIYTAMKYTALILRSVNNLYSLLLITKYIKASG